MTKKNLQKWVFLTLAIYSFAFIAGIFLRIQYPDNEAIAYSTFKDLIPFILAIPAAWLGYCFSLRLSFASQLKLLWTDINSSIQSAIRYTYKESPTQSDYHDVLMRLSISIDEVRAVFRNVGESNRKIGLYPYEEIKNIHEEFKALGYGESYDQSNAKVVRSSIISHWKNVRAPLLCEFERQEPSSPSSPYVKT